MREWEDHPHQTPPCSCQQLLKRSKFAAVDTIDGHIVSPAALVVLPEPLQTALQFSASSQIWPSLEWFVKQFKQSIKQWSDDNKMPFFPLQSCDSFVRAHWQQHLQAAKGSITFDDVQHLRKLFSNLVVFGQDHQPDHVMIFCPMRFWKMVHDTFFDQTVYTDTSLTAQQAHDRVCSNIPANLKRDLPWAWQYKQPLPFAYVLPKQKKAWTTARPIIAYSKSPIGIGLKAAALVLARVTKLVFPDSFDGNLVSIFHDLHRFFRGAPVDQALTFVNDDLIGFFTSIPQDRILHSVREVLQRYMQAVRCDHTHTFSVTLHEEQFPGQVFKGKTSAKQVNIQQLLQIVELSFKANMFVALGTVFAQVRGSTIGNQVSPIISSITVMMQEHQWQQDFSAFRSNNRWSFFARRYVDNRFIIFAQELRRTSALRALCDLDFYQAPVEIEVVHDNHFLGFNVDVTHRSVRFMMPKHAWQFRLPTSAGCKSHMLSSFRSRASLILQHTLPLEHVAEDIERLFHMYIKFGYSSQLLKPICDRMLSKVKRPAE
ncbi:unnamed protein product [Symbiodinium natans]|uniref:Reverse transcriptase domain-containing protein n=1 Tax=Symbiodinium natans TaxID=878477 RepID=A0A812LSW8_9DINO|nr:unnamed protein product [Symbiodinium natans]